MVERSDTTGEPSDALVPGAYCPSHPSSRTIYGLITYLRQIAERISSDPLIRDMIGLWPEETLPRHPVILLAARCRRLQRQARKTATMPLVARRNDEGSGIVLTPTWMMPLLESV